MSVNIHQGSNEPHGHGHAHPAPWYSRIHEHARAGRWLLITAVVLLALTAQNFRQNWFGLTRSVPGEQLSALANSTCTSNDQAVAVCERQAVNPTGLASCFSYSGILFVNGGQCSCQFSPTNDGASCAPGGWVCHLGTCIAPNDPCLGVQCPARGGEDSCSVAGQGYCSAGQCVYAADPNQNDKLCDGSDQYLGSRCAGGVCQSKTARESTAYAYAASIQSGIIAAALAIELLVTGSATPDLAVLAINFGLIAIGWTGWTEDAEYPSNNALTRSQRAFVYIVGALSFLIGVQALFRKRAKVTVAFLVIALLYIVFCVVQFALAAELFNEHFDKTAQKQVDQNANIVFNWSYNASIFAAAVNLAVAIAIIVTGTYCSGFAIFGALSGLVALAWASKHQDLGATQGADFTDTAQSWMSFAIIACAFELIGGIVLLAKGVSHPQVKSSAALKGGALLVLLGLCTVVGLVAALFDYQYFDDYYSVNGDNFNRVGPGNYANLVSPFAWPISIWTSVVGSAFALAIIIRGSPSTGLAALSLTEAALLLGWASNHVYFGSALSNNLNPLTRAWEGVALSFAVLLFFLAGYMLVIVPSEKHEDAHPQGAVPHTDEAPHSSDFINQQNQQNKP